MNKLTNLLNSRIGQKILFKYPVRGMDRIRDNLYIGRWNDAKNLKELKGARITAVLNVAADCSDPDYFAGTIRHVKVGLTDNHLNPPYMVDLAVQTLVAMLRKGETVLIHCMSGVSRSPYIAASALSVIEQRPLDDCWNDIRVKRPAMGLRSKLHINR